MSRRSANRAHATRLALVGAETPEGAHLREALAEFGLRGDRVDLYGTTAGEAVLSEYAGEARLIQEPAPGEVGDHDVIFLCELGEASSKIMASVSPDGPVVIDLAGCGVGRDDVPLVHADIDPVTDRKAGVVAVPHALSSVLSSLLSPLTRSMSVTRAHAVVLCPAADYGTPGLEELREQTVRLFNFSSVPTDVFGLQLAFNVIPFRRLGRAHVEERIASEIVGLLDLPATGLSVRLVLAPVFHGHSISLDVEADGDVDLAGVASAFDDAHGVARGEVWSPLEAAGERAVIVSDVASDGAAGVRLWAVSGETEKIPAEQAVRLADRLAGLGSR